MQHERQSIMEELSPPFQVTSPACQTTPFVFCSPHSGSVYPRAFVASSRLDPLSLRKSEDVLVDQLFSGVTSLGAPLIAARFPRAYLDVNREPYELDPELFGKGLPDWANTQSVRVIGGLGLHPAGTAVRRRHAMYLGITVVGDWQGRGVGDLLMAAAIEQADRWLGVLRLELTVYADNTRAIALYRRHGFEMEGTLRAFALRDGVYVDAYAMARIHPRPPVPVATPATP